MNIRLRTLQDFYKMRTGRNPWPRSYTRTIAGVLAVRMGLMGGVIGIISQDAVWQALRFAVRAMMMPGKSLWKATAFCICAEREAPFGLPRLPQ